MHPLLPRPAIATGAVPLGMADGGPYFVYLDKRNFSVAIPQAISRAKNKAWTQEFFLGSAGDRAADLRALIAASYLNLDDMSKVPSGKMGVDDILNVKNLGSIGADSLLTTEDRLKSEFSDVNRYVAAWTPLRAWSLLQNIYQKQGIGLEPFPAHAFAVNGGATQNVDTLVLPPPIGPPVATGFGWEVVTGIAIVGVVWLAAKAIDIYGKHVDEDDKIQAIKAGVALNIEQNRAHIDNEIKVGHSLPLSPAEINSIAATNKLMDEAAKAYGVAAQPLPKESIFASLLNPIVGPVVGGATEISKALVIGAVILGGIYVVSVLGKKT